MLALVWLRPASILLVIIRGRGRVLLVTTTTTTTTVLLLVWLIRGRGAVRGLLSYVLSVKIPWRS